VGIEILHRIAPEQKKPAEIAGLNNHIWGIQGAKPPHIGTPGVIRTGSQTL